MKSECRGVLTHMYRSIFLLNNVSFVQQETDWAFDFRPASCWSIVLSLSAASRKQSAISALGHTSFSDQHAQDRAHYVLWTVFLLSWFHINSYDLLFSSLALPKEFQYRWSDNKHLES